MLRTKYGVKKLRFLGSSCIYPKLAPQPLKEEYLLTGSLEETNEVMQLQRLQGSSFANTTTSNMGLTSSQ